MDFKNGDILRDKNNNEYIYTSTNNIMESCFLFDINKFHLLKISSDMINGFYKKEKYSSFYNILKIKGITLGSVVEYNNSNGIILNITQFYITFLFITSMGSCMHVDIYPNEINKVKLIK